MKSPVGILAVGLVLCGGLGFGTAARAVSTVPFVGCVGTGWRGAAAPVGEPVQVDLPTDVAAKLAYYSGENLGVLAPRGWECAGGDSISNFSLRVVPPGQPARGPQVYGVLLLATSSNDPNGQLVNMLYGHAYFPQAVTQDLVAVWLAHNSEVTAFAVTKYSDDVLDYDAADSVRFTTPAGRNGLGLDFFPVADAGGKRQLGAVPTAGFFLLVPGPFVKVCETYQFAARLPGEVADLAGAISRYAEQQAQVNALSDCVE